jgi:hypothetical protein
MLTQVACWTHMRHLHNCTREEPIVLTLTTSFRPFQTDTKEIRPGQDPTAHKVGPVATVDCRVPKIWEYGSHRLGLSIPARYAYFAYLIDVGGAEFSRQSSPADYHICHFYRVPIRWLQIRLETMVAAPSGWTRRIPRSSDSVYLRGPQPIGTGTQYLRT